MPQPALNRFCARVQLTGHHDDNEDRSITKTDGTAHIQIMPPPEKVAAYPLMNIIDRNLRDQDAPGMASGGCDTATPSYKTLFNNVGDAVFVAPLSPDGIHGNFTAVNDVACARLGYTRDELLQMNARSLNPPAN
ncbi:MAG: PAS domain-containing protein, partial [Acidiferrobacteraceae bacterium]